MEKHIFKRRPLEEWPLMIQSSQWQSDALHLLYNLNRSLVKQLSSNLLIRRGMSHAQITTTILPLEL